MFGRIKQIAEGWTNLVLNEQEELYKKRFPICKECPLFSPSLIGPLCDSKKCLNLKTGEMQEFPSEGVVCGCGCQLNAKTRTLDAHCVLKKW